MYDKMREAVNRMRMSMRYAGAAIVGLAEAILEEAWRKLREEKPAKKPERRARPGWALQPGPDTPAWNELARQVAAHLRKRGDKVKLARLLNLPRQRIHQLFVARTACADAERTLLLLAWLQAKREGREWV
jgi:hypothetical protein